MKEENGMTATPVEPIVMRSSRVTVTLYCGDCLDLLPIEADAVVTDPPYGIKYKSGKTGHDGGTALPGIVGDDDTSLRDEMLQRMDGVPSIVFGTWKRAKPSGLSAVLIWEKGDHVGMGDLSLPWKPNTEEIYVIGRGFEGHRGTSVLRHNAPVTWNSASFGRTHPHEKPLSLMRDIIGKCQQAWTILDPFMGSGSTGVACVREGRNFIGVEKDEKYFEIAVERIRRELVQERLF